MATTERTDAERMAWCFLNSVEIQFANYGKDKCVELWGWDFDGVRKIRSSKHALDAWRKAVDEAMLPLSRAVAEG